MGRDSKRIWGAALMDNRGARRTTLAPEHVESRRRRRCLVAVMVAVVAVVVLVGYGRYELSHNLPNPYWGIFGTSYTYTFEAGPPGVGLLDTRPDEIVSRFIYDYIGVAGTFPCVAVLATYETDLFAPDPVRRGEVCPVHRRMAAAHIGTTRVYTTWRTIPLLAGTPEAYVSFRIDYEDGERLEHEFQLEAGEGLLSGTGQSQPYFRNQIHVKCWSLFEAYGFYPNIVAEPPRGVEYGTSKPVKRHCAGFE